MNNIILDEIEQEKAERLEKLLFRMFRENMRYLLRIYKVVKLPQSMFNTDQVEWLRFAFKLEAYGDTYFIIKDKP